MGAINPSQRRLFFSWVSVLVLPFVSFFLFFFCFFAFPSPTPISAPPTSHRRLCFSFSFGRKEQWRPSVETNESAKRIERFVFHWFLFFFLVFFIWFCFHQAARHWFFIGCVLRLMVDLEVIGLLGLSRFYWVILGLDALEWGFHSL